MQGNTINEKNLCEKAVQIFVDLIKTLGSSTDEEEAFNASRDRFEKFKRRNGIYGVVRRAESANLNTKAAKNFIGVFKNLVKSECYLPQQIFSCDETTFVLETDAEAKLYYSKEK